ncbi:MAG: hypothetical protein NTV80_23125 [Verrucomicrobia bacterium]|nr:hypothetical protein [Verrucomicrobiota bacterium]
MHNDAELMIQEIPRRLRMLQQSLNQLGLRLGWKKKGFREKVGNGNAHIHTLWKFERSASASLQVALGRG